MALAVESWKDGDVGIGADVLAISLDLDGKGFVPFCTEAVNQNLSPEKINWKDMCGGGAANEVTTGINYTIPFSTVQRKGTLGITLNKNMFEVKKGQNIPCRVDNTLADFRVEFAANVSVEGVTGEAGDLVRVTGTISVFRADSINTGEISTWPTSAKSVNKNKQK